MGSESAVNKPLLKIRYLDYAQSDCEICEGEGWVCEEHPKTKWGEGDGCCGGAGMLCECNLLKTWERRDD